MANTFNETNPLFPKKNNSRDSSSLVFYHLFIFTYLLTLLNNRASSPKNYKKILTKAQRLEINFMPNHHLHFQKWVRDQGKEEWNLHYSLFKSRRKSQTKRMRTKTALLKKPQLRYSCLTKQDRRWLMMMMLNK